MPDAPCSWPPPPESIDLPEGHVHLWCARLDPAEELLARLRGVLSADEIHRAERFRAGTLRSRFIAGRGTLRLILAKYLRAQPAALRLNYQAHGKPELAAPWNADGLEFNVSHSHDLAVFAFARGCQIGVDVEWVRPMPNAAGLMERFFSPDEVAQWRRVPAELKQLSFFHGWTRKEAWLKAVGSGLAFPLSEFCVTLAPFEPARVLSIQGDARRGAEWWLESNEPCPGYVATVAIRGQPAKVHGWRF